MDSIYRWRYVIAILMFFALLGGASGRAYGEPGNPGDPLTDAEWRYVGTMASSICRSLVMPGVDSIAAVVGTKEAIQASGGFEDRRAIEIMYVTVQIACPGEMVVITDAIEKNEKIQEGQKREVK